MRTNASRVAYNTASQLIARLLTAAIGFFSIVLTTRYLGLDLYGQLTTVVVFIGILGTFTDAGITNITIRELSQSNKKHSEIIGSVLILRSVIGLFVSIGAIAAGYLIYDSPAVRYGITVLSITLLLATLQTAVSAALSYKLRNDLIAVGDVLGKIVALLTLIVAIHMNYGFSGIILATLLGAIVNFFSNLYFGLRSMVPLPKIDVAYWRYILRLSIPLGAAGILGSLYFRLDGFLLSLMKGSFDVGLYGLSYKIVELTMTIPIFFTTSLFPILAQQFANKDRVTAITNSSLKVLGLLAAPISVGSIVLAEELVKLFGGDQFRAAALPMAILMAGNFFVFYSFAYNNALLAVNRQIRLLQSAGLALILNISLNLFLIPAYGVVGAAISVLITEICVLILLWYMCKQDIGRTSILASFVPMINALIMGFVAYSVKLKLARYIETEALLVFIIIAVSALTYSVLILVTKMVSVQEVRNIVRARQD